MLHRLVVSLLLLSAAGASAVAQQAVADAGAECVKRSAGGMPDLASSEARESWRQQWAEICARALETRSGDAQVRSAAAAAFSANGRRAEALDLWRALGRDGDAAALFEIYDVYKSSYRVLGRTQLVTRPEAEAALRKAAELQHPPAMWLLAVLLDRGSTVRRDAAEAIVWAERALRRPPAGTGHVDIEVRLGHFLAKSARPEDLARGIEILERHAAGRGRGEAKAYLAQALRSTDPTRARTLLEAAVKDAPGHAIPLLVQMLLAGEGGKADAKRAVSLLRSGRASDVGAVRAALGRLMIEGRHVPQNVAEGIGLVRHEAVWSLDAQKELLGLLAAHPAVRIDRPEGLLYDVLEAAELDEPGMLEAIVSLKLSQSTQFRDPEGACKLVATYRAQGRAVAAASAGPCREQAPR